MRMPSWAPYKQQSLTLARLLKLRSYTSQFATLIQASQQVKPLHLLRSLTKNWSTQHCRQTSRAPSNATNVHFSTLMYGDKVVIICSQCFSIIFCSLLTNFVVLGVVPEDTTSPPHQLMRMYSCTFWWYNTFQTILIIMIVELVQDFLQGLDMDMETTPHATIINRRSPNKQTTRADQDRRLMATVNSFDSNHDWLGPLKIKGIQVTRQAVDTISKQQQHFPIWECSFE